MAINALPQPPFPGAAQNAVGARVRDFEVRLHRLVVEAEGHQDTPE